MDQTVVGNDFLGCYRAIGDDDGKTIYFLDAYDRSVFWYHPDEGFTFTEAFKGNAQELVNHITTQFEAPQEDA